MSTQHSTDPGSKSPEEVQREVRQSRAEVEETLEAIQERLSPGQLFEQAVDYMRSSNGTNFLRNLGTAVRDNPVPVALVGTGLAWLMLSGSRAKRRGYDDDDLLDEYAEGRYGAGDYPAGYYVAGDYVEDYDDETDFGETPGSYEHRSGGKGFIERAKRTAEAARRRAQRLRMGGQAGAYELSENASETAQGWGESARESARRARETAGEWSAGARASARSARDRARRLGASASHRVSETGEQLWHGAREAGGRATYYGRRARRGFFETLHEHPLVLGALGLAVGAALGAALPTTEKEDDWLGDTRDRLKDRAKEAGREQVEKARAAAGAAFSAAREEAERQGLTTEGGKAAVQSAAESVQRKAERVAEAATEAAKSEAERQGLGQTPGNRSA
jgi:Protein of unknown function (DUF3618)